MIGAVITLPSTGLVGPVGCNVSGAQDLGVHYTDAYGLVLWQNWIHRTYLGKVVPADRLVGFCLLITRACFEKVGVLDEGFGVGCYDDDDYCLRAKEAGFTLLVALDVWIHHEGSRTFRSQRIDYGKLMEANRKKFLEKWDARMKVHA
jgi:GT2 family glycosyltransferase